MLRIPTDFVMFEFFQEWTIYQILTFGLLVIMFLIAVSRGLKTLYNWFKKRKERKEYTELMEDPLEVHFLIPTLKDYKITYEKQDAKKHHTRDELELPKGIEDAIFLRIQPRINVKVGDRYFGFRIKETRKKPEISYSSAYVTQGSIKPEWYQDWYGHLHFTEERFWFKDEPYISSFKIKTHEKGDYMFYMYFHLSCYEHKSVKEERHTVFEKTLKIRVK